MILQDLSCHIAPEACDAAEKAFESGLANSSALE